MLGVFGGVAGALGHFRDANAAANIMANSKAMQRAIKAAQNGHLDVAQHYLTTLGTPEPSVAQAFLDAGLPPGAVGGFIGAVNQHFDMLEGELYP